MKEIDVFSLTDFNKKSGKSFLLFNNKPTQLMLAGAVLEKQLAVKDDYLIITSFDCMYEEYLSIYLLDNSFKVKDLIYVEFGYLSGVIAIFNDFKILSNNKISFKFGFDEPYKLKILNIPKRLSKLPPYFKRKWYKKFCLKYFYS